MASPQGITFNFLYFQPPPATATHPPPPPAHKFPPLQPHVLPPPPPVPHPVAPPPPHVLPPPTPHPHPFAPPPPHIHPPPYPLPPPLAPDQPHHMVIIIVVISCGGLLFGAFLAAALFCFLKKRKKKTHKEKEVIHFDKHRQVKEEIVKGPHGTEAVILSIEDDVHIAEEVKKDEKVSKGSHYKDLDIIESSEGFSTNAEVGGRALGGPAGEHHPHHYNQQHLGSKS